MRIGEASQSLPGAPQAHEPLPRLLRLPFLSPFPESHHPEWVRVMALKSDGGPGYATPKLRDLEGRSLRKLKENLSDTAPAFYPDTAHRRGAFSVNLRKGAPWVPKTNGSGEDPSNQVSLRFLSAAL